MNNQETYITYSFYNAKNQRLTIYYNGNGQVRLIPFFKTHQFSKRLGRSICEDESDIHIATLEVFNITFYKQKDFLDWCRVKYFKKDTITMYLHDATVFTKIIKVKHGKKLIQEYLYKETVK